MTRRFLITTALVAACLLAQAGWAYADDLGIQSVNTSGWPTVGVTLTLPSSAKGAVPSAVRVWENDVEVPGATIKGVSPDHQAVDVVLLMDVSGSMKGAPLADAQAAARNFASLMGPADRVALVAFDSPPRVVSGLSGDSAAVQGAINGLTIRGRTGLYDGIVTASDVLKSGSTGRKAIIVLSDGQDSGSTNDLNTAVAAAKAAGAPVYAVALKSGVYDPKPLGTIASATGGRLASVNQSTSFSEIFGALATELQQGYEVTYRSLKPNTPDLQVKVAVDGTQVPLSKTLFVSNPDFNASQQSFVPLAPRTFGQIVAMLATQTSIVLLVGLCIGLLGFIVVRSVIREKRPIDELAFYDQVHATGFESVPTQQGTADPSRLRVLGLVGDVAARHGFTGLARTKLERAGLPLRPNEYILLHTLGVLIVGLLAGLITRNPVVTVILVIVSTAAPLMWLNSREAHRRTAFEDQLPDILMLMAGSLRAGWGLQQSIDLVVQQAAEPAITEFGRVQAEVRLGLPLDQALYRVAERLDSTDFRWTASAIAIQREVGGNLSEVLETLAATMRERESLVREVKALTAEGRFSAIILVLLPFFLAGGLFFINPRYISLMFTSPFGITVLSGGVVLLIIGIFWLQKVVSIDV